MFNSSIKNEIIIMILFHDDVIKGSFSLWFIVNPSLFIHTIRTRNPTVESRLRRKYKNIIKLNRLTRNPLSGNQVVQCEGLEAQ